MEVVLTCPKVGSNNGSEGSAVLVKNNDQQSLERRQLRHCGRVK